MCGIAGYVTQERRSIESAVQAAMDAEVRRGPDSCGMSTWPGVALGHRRLAIVDLSDAGRQPMISNDGQVGIVFNGCIYNFLDLRQELTGRGHKFRSRCDTEVLLHGYREWGIDELVGRLRGMFAFGVWDQPRRTLTLVRDRLGVKPLVYCARDGEIAFASTVGALRAGGFGGGINASAILDFLEFGFITEDRAVYEGMSKLPPASIVEWCDGRISHRQYWALPECDESSRITFPEAVEETERILVESVRTRLFADVPIGALLSGGVDSALVCWAMHQLGADIKAFTVAATGDASDESAAAADTARRIGIQHEIVEMPDADFSLDDLTDAYCEPFACQSALAMLWVSRAVKRRATVLLTGDGGDDVFLGYPFLYYDWLAQRLARRLPEGVAGAWRGLRKVVPRFGPARRMTHFLDYATGGVGEHARARDGLPYFEQRTILGERLANLRLPQREIPPSLESARRLLSDVVAYHRRMHFTAEFMPKVDGATMYYGIEARAPLLDQELWEYAAALPAEVRFHGGRLKAVLREIARRRIGPEVAFRKKQGFTVPVESWLAHKGSGKLELLRKDTLVEGEGWVRPGALRAPIQRALADRWIPVQLWRLLVLEHWLQRAGMGRPTPIDRQS